MHYLKQSDYETHWIRVDNGTRSCRVLASRILETASWRR